ncbi:MAG: hypothetical protein C4346_01965 [Chloroflexota bacterium]
MQVFSSLQVAVQELHYQVICGDAQRACVLAHFIASQGVADRVLRKLSQIIGVLEVHLLPLPENSPPH